MTHNIDLKPGERSSIWCRVPDRRLGDKRPLSAGAGADAQQGRCPGRAWARLPRWANGFETGLFHEVAGHERPPRTTSEKRDVISNPPRAAPEPYLGSKVSNIWLPSCDTLISCRSPRLMLAVLFQEFRPNRCLSEADDSANCPPPATPACWPGGLVVGTGIFPGLFQAGKNQPAPTRAGDAGREETDGCCCMMGCQKPPLTTPSCKRLVIVVSIY
ncbi:uncharacterized protein [Struthio camelus]|uniref:uncharacterized protein n=1 Tax=Struthio camelus TaxID=8801 RepID=UPI003603C0E7